MSTAEPQIVELYKRGCTAEVIAQALSKPLDYVTAVLYEDVPAFRMAVAAADKPAGQPVEDEMLDIIASVARHSDNPFAKLAAAKYVRDDLKGRRDAAPVVNNTAILVEINKQQAGLEDARRKFKRPGAAGKIVDATVVGE